jgi:N-acetyl-gamma-glutamyl-phosphate reductase
VAARTDLDAVFLALPHGVASAFARPLFDAGHRVFDLSADLRLSDPHRYAEFYGTDHPDPQLLGEAYYALADGPDRADWAEARLFACPGCYPTSILLPLLPLARAGLLAPESPIVAVGLSGVSGAGRKASEDFSFCERNESVRAYGQPIHRHLSELEEQLARAAGQALPIQFLPHLIPMQRGILSTISLGGLAGDAAAVRATWAAAYGDRPFVRILPEGQLPETGLVVGSNRIDLAVHDDPRTGRVVLNAAIDNLVKGASGQALQLMNLRCGRPEAEGLL